MYKYIVTFVILNGVCQFTGEVRFTNRADAIEFHDSTNFARPNSAKIDSVLLKKITDEK